MKKNSENQNEFSNDLSRHFHSLHSETGIREIPLQKLSRRKPLVFAPETTLQDTLIALSKGGFEAGVVAVQADTPLGIVTLRNLLDAITLQGGTLEDPVIASKPVVIH